MGSRYSRPASLVTASLTGLLLVAGAGHASSHRDAPFVSQHPAIDGTDFYMFRSYEAGREDTVTLIANYQPFQAPFSGPNYYPFDEQALYEIHIDNTGDGHEDLTFGFRFDNGQSGGYDAGDVNDRESYTATMTVGDRRSGSVERVTNLDEPGVAFIKPANSVTVYSTPLVSNYFG